MTVCVCEVVLTNRLCSLASVMELYFLHACVLINLVELNVNFEHTLHLN